MTRTLSDYVVEVLARRGVRQIYGYPGASILPLMDAVERHPEVRWILVRNEAAASLCASAEAKLTGRLAVCVATSGPGATNLVTGLLDAQSDRAPVLAITGMLPLWRQRRAEFQDLDQARFLAQLIGFSVECGHPDQLPSLLRECIGRAEQERTVVHMALPHDIQSVEPADSRFELRDAPEPLHLQPAPSHAFDIVGETLKHMVRVAIVVGPRALGAGAAIEKLAERLSAPMITTLDAKGIIDESHPLALGVLGVFGAPGVQMTQDLLSGADGVLAFGVDDLAPFIAGPDGVQLRDLIQCEPDFSSVTHIFRRTRTLVGPLEDTAKALLSRAHGQRDQTLRQHATRLKEAFEDSASHEPVGAGYVHPITFLRALNRHLDEQAVVALDIGDNTLWSAEFLRFHHRQRVLVSHHLGAMGFCLPALIAARLAHPDATVVGICGDGGLQMVIGELATAVQLHEHMVLAVFNNGVLQRVAAQQAHGFGTQLTNPDFVAVARAYGADGARIDADTPLEATLEIAFAHRGSPYLLDVRCDPAVQAPMSKWQGGFTPFHFT